MHAELPDIDTALSAMREVVAAADAYNAAHPDEPEGTGPEWERWTLAFAAVRTLVSDIDQEASHAR